MKRALKGEFLLQCSDSKTGSLYEKCYPNETCNKGLICDIENSLCVQKWCKSNNDCASGDLRLDDLERRIVPKRRRLDTSGVQNVQNFVNFQPFDGKES
jgi:hypothetical protein